MRPQEGDYAPYYGSYIALVKGNDVIDALEKSNVSTQAFLKTIPEAKGNFAYAEGKWSVKQVLLHLADSERVFTYRALSIGRGDTISLPGFDENIWADNSAPEKRTIADVAEEFSLARKNTIHLFKTFDKETLSRKGVANNNPVSVLALGFMIAGHEIHHMNVLKERYKL